ncbi:MAG TPA: glutamyl-tRNA reductase [Candidatus Binatia bacterium]|nr:glutamyl-tRNA reductase [Candidatus Binatia bacterium]
MQLSAKTLDIVNVRITHKTARVPLLEAVSFKDKANAYAELRSLIGALEMVLIQTCNRIELFLVSEDGYKTVKSAVEYLSGRASGHTAEAFEAIEYAVNRDAVTHLLQVASGLESMVIGEDQVINQVWNAYLEAEKANTVGPVLSLLFNRAVNAGRRVRRETGINKGAVSVGSAAVELAEKLLGSLNEKKILVMGAGETGTLVAKAMARRCLNPIFIANRTYERALRLAEELGGQAVTFDKLGQVLVNADVVFCSTSAPHYLLTKDLISWINPARQNKNNLLIIDISNPRNVEETIGDLPHIRLYNIDDLTSIAEQNKQERQKNVQQAYKIVDEEVAVLNRALKADSVREIVSDLLSQIEKSRQSELAKALKMIGELDERQKKIISNLTSILLKQTFLPVVENIRRAATNDEIEIVEVAARLFEIK